MHNAYILYVYGTCTGTGRNRGIFNMMMDGCINHPSIHTARHKDSSVDIYTMLVQYEKQKMTTDQRRHMTYDDKKPKLKNT